MTAVGMGTGGKAKLSFDKAKAKGCYMMASEISGYPSDFGHVRIQTRKQESSQNESHPFKLTSSHRPRGENLERKTVMEKILNSRIRVACGIQ
jgi:hypothetical protein